MIDLDLPPKKAGTGSNSAYEQEEAMGKDQRLTFYSISVLTLREGCCGTRTPQALGVDTVRPVIVD
eukprot:3372639-Amphidinium_carterae.1